MFYYRVPVDTRLELKNRGRIVRFVNFSKGELLTERELRVWLHRANYYTCFHALQGCEYSCRAVIKIGKRRFEP